MIIDEIEMLRKQLNDMVSSGEVSSEQILYISQKLDLIILQYYKDFSKVS